MAYKISDIPTHNTAPGGTRKIELENPTGPQSEWATLAEIFAANHGTAIGFKATLSGDQGGLANGVFTLAEFSTELYDRGGFYDNSAGNFRWTPPAGLVALSPCVLMDAAATAPDFAEVMVFKNGAQLNGALLTCANASFAGGAVTVHDISNGTDFYDCRVFPAFGGGIRKIFNNSLTHFEGVWLGL